MSALQLKRGQNSSSLRPVSGDLYVVIGGIFAWDSAELTLGIYTQGLSTRRAILYLLLGRLSPCCPQPRICRPREPVFGADGALTVAALYRIAYRLVRRPFIAAATRCCLVCAADMGAGRVAEVYRCTRS
jgi:hypothetical protein